MPDDENRGRLSEPAPGALLPATKAPQVPQASMLAMIGATLGHGVLQRKLQRRARERADRSATPLQRNGGGAAPSATEALMQGGGGSGQGLPGPVRDKMERSYGVDFSDVRVFPESTTPAAVGARAYTTGNEIHFAPGEYQPVHQTGQSLIGHELAHVVQQRAGRVGAAGQGKDAPVVEDAALEQEADVAGERAARGEAARVAIPSSPSGDQRHGAEQTASVGGALPSGAGPGKATQLKKKHKQPIVYLGMNPEAAEEAHLLGRQNAANGGVITITNSPAPDQIREGKVTHDLSTAEGIEGYLESIGTDPAKEEALANLLQSVDPGARDEVGKLIRLYLQVEHGQRQMERVVLSGHSVGTLIWGDGNGMLQFQTLIELGRILPKASGQVRDLMLSACYTGTESAMQQYLQMFPHLQTVWAYSHSSPGTYSGAQQHLKLWERATRAAGHEHLDPSLAHGTRKGENVATWTAEDGYKGDSPLSEWEAERAVTAAEPAYHRALLGQEEVSDPQSGPLRDYYNAVQRLLGIPGVDSGRRAELEQRRDQTIRLLFYRVVREKFVQTYGVGLKQGYDEIGARTPDYGKLGRGAALAAIAEFGTRDDGKRGAAYGEARRLLERGLRNLDSTIIPANWI